MDLIGPFHPSPQGNKYILTVLDHLTGWAEAYPIPNKTSESVFQKFYHEFVARFGTPKVIITDQGQEFMSHSFRELMKGLGITHKRSTPGHPEMNGAVERFNKTLKDTLRKMVNNDVSAWEDQLGPALFAYRISDGRTRGSNPSHILFGVEPNVDSTYQTEVDRLENMQETRRAAHLSQVKGKEYRQKHGPTGNRQILVGNYVTLECAEPQTMTHLRDGALKVTSVRGNVVGVVPLADPLCKPKHFHTNRLRAVPSTLTWEGPPVCWAQ